MRCFACPRVSNWTAFSTAAAVSDSPTDKPISIIIMLLPLPVVLVVLLPLLVAGDEQKYWLRKRRWDRRTLTWRLDSKNINGADEYLLRNTLHRAFDEWQAVSTLRFEEKEDGPTDVVIAFERGKHDDSFPFDGKDGVVAHAFFPRDGRLHFDADEDWTLNSPQGVNLFQTAVHEVGHLLGLPHSSDPRAAMNVGKKPYDPDFRLGEDDIRSIRRLYPPEQRFKPYFSPFETISKTSHSGFPFPLPETVTSTSSDRLFRFLRV